MLFSQLFFTRSFFLAVKYQLHVHVCTAEMVTCTVGLTVLGVY